MNENHSNIRYLNAKFIQCIESLSKTILDQRRKDGTIEHYNDALAVMSKVKSGKQFQDAEEFAGTQIDEDIISKTIMQFYFDGYDTSTNLMLPIIFLLSLNPDAQVCENETYIIKSELIPIESEIYYECRKKL